MPKKINVDKWKYALCALRQIEIASLLAQDAAKLALDLSASLQGNPIDNEIINSQHLRIKGDMQLLNKVMRKA